MPLAHGTDGLGSIRQPAAACGVLGLKPSRGLIPAELGQNDWYGLAENGPMATTVADLALMLSVMADQPALAEGPPTSPITASRRLGQATRAGGAHQPGDHRGTLRGSRPAAQRTVTTSSVTSRRTPSGSAWPEPSVGSRWPLTTSTDVADPSLLQARTVGHASAGRRLRPFVRSEQLIEWRDKVDAFFDSYDIMLTPVTATHPLRAERWSERAWAANVRANVAASGGFAGMWNVAGFPALAVPFGVDTVTGTPIGLQLAARHGREALLLSVAARIEAWRPWAVDGTRVGMT